MSSTTIETKAKTKNSIKRAMFCVFAMAVEVTCIVLLFTTLNSYAPILECGTRILAFVLVLYIYNENVTATFKMPWVMLILVFPVFGVILYLLVGHNNGTKKMRERYINIDGILFQFFDTDEQVNAGDVNEAVKADDAESAHTVLEEVHDLSPKACSIASYIRNNASYPIYKNTDVTYYDDALKGLDAQLEEMKKAEHFIFMEYHAIEDDRAWKRIQDVLEERVAHGVEVRVFYDDMGSVGFVNMDFAKKMESKGIACRVFNPFMPGLNMFLNNRDHRKITVIDGKVGFTGGYNLANEYFNYTHPYGDWKDTGIRLEGDAVFSLTITFLEMWNAIDPGNQDYGRIARYLPKYEYTAKESDGYIQPYAFGPMSEERIGENVYISMAEKAEDYCWFITPYLIITDEMMHAFSLAAKRGVDVRIITPGIPDKKLIYEITRSFYSDLVSAGVRIYEWTPGFCHAKMSIADDLMATCGTINLDYRSLYHHFENGCFMVNMQAVADMKADFEHTFTECREVTEQYKQDQKAKENIKCLMFRLFAQLM